MLREISRKKPSVKNHVPEHVEKAVVELAIENLAVFSGVTTAGIVVLVGGVYLIWKG